MWGATIIQKLARGYIARKTIVRSYKIRAALSSEVLGMAEKYLKNGDVWGLLREVCLVRMEDGVIRVFEG